MPLSVLVNNIILWLHPLFHVPLIGLYSIQWRQEEKRQRLKGWPCITAQCKWDESESSWACKLSMYNLYELLCHLMLDFIIIQAHGHSQGCHPAVETVVRELHRVEPCLSQTWPDLGDKVPVGQGGSIILYEEGKIWGVLTYSNRLLRAAMVHVCAPGCFNGYCHTLPKWVLWGWHYKATPALRDTLEGKVDMIWTHKQAQWLSSVL